VHFTHILQGHFLPWHRWFTALYEKGLRDECGYSGAQPYWDWTLDVTSVCKFGKSPVFDPVFGFGGNGPWVPSDGANPGMDVPGRTGGGCVKNGPFKDMVVNLGPQGDLSGNPRCLKRDFSPSFAHRYLGMNQTKLTLDQPDYGTFDRVVEGGPSFDASGVHGGGHYSVGGTFGQMGDLYTSPADPIFFLHHANLDRVWWSWQMRDLPNRLKDISGPINLMDYDNLQGGNVTLDFEMTMGVNAKNITVGDTMNIMGDTFCFTYDELY
jgi:tyrosinase